MARKMNTACSFAVLTARENPESGESVIALPE
jgi:hypothetical protein